MGKLQEDPTQPSLDDKVDESNVSDDANEGCGELPVEDAVADVS